MERCCALWEDLCSYSYEGEMVANEDLLLTQNCPNPRDSAPLQNSVSGAKLFQRWYEFLVEGKQTNKLSYQIGFRWCHRVCKPWSRRQISHIDLLKNDRDCLEVSYEHYFLLVLYFQTTFYTHGLTSFHVGQVLPCSSFWFPSSFLLGQICLGFSFSPS